MDTTDTLAAAFKEVERITKAQEKPPAGRRALPRDIVDWTQEDLQNYQRLRSKGVWLDINPAPLQRQRQVWQEVRKQHADLPLSEDQWTDLIATVVVLEGSMVA